ncbi:MAG: glycogen/starch synthase, partial [Spirochaetales bacterium]|nr:glycogen/starch synthase [Spirochaetales bacterium]
VIVDVVPHINRTSRVVDDSFKVYCHGENGELVPRAATDGRFGSWNDGMLLNYRKFEVWEWFADCIGQLIESYDIDGIRLDSAHALPIMMKRYNGRVTGAGIRSVKDVVEGTIVLNDREDDHFITTGYYDSSCRENIANPFLTYLTMRLGKTVKAKAKKSFLVLAESYWGRERYLARTACMPYNSALFKICEKVVQGLSDVREIYHLYGEYYSSALPRGTKLLGILGNHDERRPLNTFGDRGLRAAVGLIVFLNAIVMDFEGNAEGEGWKIFVDNIYVNWNAFEAMSNRGVQSFYREIYKFHAQNSGDAYLVWANNNQVAAVALFTEESIWLGAFNFSGSGQEAYIQFDDPSLPFDDEAPYELTDPMYGKVTNRTVHFVGKELRISRIHLFVSETDRMRILRLDPAPPARREDDDYLIDSFQRLVTLERSDRIESSLFFEIFREWVKSPELLIERLERLLPLLEGRLSAAEIQSGFARAIFHLARVGGSKVPDLERVVRLMTGSGSAPISELGEFLAKWNRKGTVVFLTAEADPFSKSGGLASVMADLPRELAGKGEEAIVITPKYRQGSRKAVAKMQAALQAYKVTYTGRNISFYLDGILYEVGVHTALVANTRYYLLDHHEFFDGLYWGYTAEDKIRRRVAFARACCELLVTFDVKPLFVITNDAFTGLFGPIMRHDPRYMSHPAFERTKLIHLIHNGGWEYFDAFYRFERGRDFCSILGLPGGNEWLVTDPHRDDRINCMASGIRNADRVFTVSPSYARQIQERCDGLEGILHDVVGINNALNRDYRAQARKKAQEDFVENQYAALAEMMKNNEALTDTIKRRFPQIIEGPKAVRRIANERRRAVVERMMYKLMLQVSEGLEVDPDKVLCVMIHRVSEQKGFQLLLEASEGVFKLLGFQAILGGAPAPGDTRGEELARGLSALGGYYPGKVSVHVDFLDVRVPLIGGDVFLMPSLNEPGGISQLEALACGCIVVARSTGGLRDTVTPIRREGRAFVGNGFLFPDYTSWSFYHAMERCMLFFSSGSEEEIAAVRRNAVKSVRYWDETAVAYVKELYGMREMLHPLLG